MSVRKEQMTTPNSRDWKDLPKPLNCFTVRNAAMINLNTNKIVRNYLANTKIVVVQKCVMPEGTYYRTAEAAHHYLNYAFKASDFGLPNEKAPSAHSSKPNSSGSTSHKSSTRISSSMKKQKSSKQVVSAKGGEKRRPRSWLKRLFRRKK